MAGHTKTPWMIQSGTNIFGRRSDLDIVATVATTGGLASNRTDCTIENEANAAFIVRACNAYEDLLAACERAWQEADEGSELVCILSAAIKKARG